MCNTMLINTLFLGIGIGILHTKSNNDMDREISHKEQKKANYGKYFKYLLYIGLIIGAFFLLRKFLKKSGSMDEFHIAYVEQGDILGTVSANGTVKPAFEREVNAPVNTEIKSVKIPKGTVVSSGDLIMELDQEFTQLEYDRLYDELELRKNNISKLNLQYDKDLKDLDYQDQIKALELNQLRAQVKDQERLVEIGGATAEELESAKLNLQVSEIQKKMLENNLEYTKSANVKEKRNLELELKIQEKRLQELKRKLSETSVKAPLNGVITWINENIGKTVNAGEPLVRIADLDKYIIEASTSDRNQSKIYVGMPAKVKINKSELDGIISAILPAVENNAVKFLVELEDPGSKLLRPNMNAQVFLVTGSKENVLKLKNGQAIKGGNTVELFVIRDGVATKTRISKGIVNADYVEISGGNLKKGDKVIISETEDYDHLDQFTINK